MTQLQTDEIKQQLAASCADTFGLLDLAREADLHESPGFGFRPVIWHLADIGVVEAYWLLQKLAGEPAPDARYERLFDPISTPREASKDLPTRREMENYLTRVRTRVLKQLDHLSFNTDEPLLRDAYIYHLVLEHERQHQETLAYLLQLLGPQKKMRPQITSTIAPDAAAQSTTQAVSAPPHDMIKVPAGEFTLGAQWPVFAYDN